LNGTVKKVGPLKISHERYRAKKFKDDLETFRSSFQFAVGHNPELAQHLSKAQDDLHPLRVLHLFMNVTDEDVELLGMDPRFGRPEHYIWTYFPVPPAGIRPSVVQDAQTRYAIQFMLGNSTLRFLTSLICLASVMKMI
jgi:DNA-directed RNA polymerase III subunit RPC1